MGLENGLEISCGGRKDPGVKWKRSRTIFECSSPLSSQSTEYWCSKIMLLYLIFFRCCLFQNDDSLFQLTTYDFWMSVSDNK